VAHHTEKVGFPNSPLSAGMKIVLEARNPTTDATVAGVSASRWSIFGNDESEVGAEPPPEQLPIYVLPLGGPA
jgi:hypothetical protein